MKKKLAVSWPRCEVQRRQNMPMVVIVCYRLFLETLRDSLVHVVTFKCFSNFVCKRLLVSFCYEILACVAHCGNGTPAKTAATVPQRWTAAIEETVGFHRTCVKKTHESCKQVYKCLAGYSSSFGSLLPEWTLKACDWSKQKWHVSVVSGLYGSTPVLGFESLSWGPSLIPYYFTAIWRASWKVQSACGVWKPA